MAKLSRRINYGKLNIVDCIIAMPNQSFASNADRYHSPLFSALVLQVVFTQ